MRSFFLAGLLAQGALSQSVKSCGGPNDHLKNPVIKLTPDPPVKGGSLTIQASGTLDEAEASFNSNVDLNIKALGIVHASVKGGVPMSITPGAVAGPFSLTIGPISLPSFPGSVVVTGQVHVTNGKNEPIMCIDLDLNVQGADNEKALAPPRVDEPAVSTISSCGKSTDHIPDFQVASSNGVITMSGTMDEAVTKASIDLDVSLKVLFVSVPLKMTIPIGVSDGLIKKGAIKSTVGPSTITISPDVKATLKGTMKMNDGNGEEIMCLNVDTVVASAAPQSQCKAASYAFCCEVGKPCDCTKGTTAPGQCDEASYGFCCSVGTPCDCTQPPSPEFMAVVV